MKSTASSLAGATKVVACAHLDLWLDLVKQRLNLVHIRRLLRPANAEAFGRVGFRDLW
jgi:hypothetical protein